MLGRTNLRDRGGDGVKGPSIAGAARRRHRYPHDVTGPSTETPAPSELHPRRERGSSAVIAVVLSGLLAFLVAAASFGLFRGTLHFGCSWGIGGEWGEDGTWSCGDGIGFVVVAVGLGGMSALLLFVGVLTAIARPSPLRATAYIVLATVSLGWVAWWSFYGATSYSGPRPEGETGAGLWAAAVLPGLALCALGLLAGAWGAIARRRWSPIAVWTGVGLIVVGTAVQPGIGVATLVSAGLLVAAADNQPLRR